MFVCLCFSCLTLCGGYCRIIAGLERRLISHTQTHTNTHRDTRTHMHAHAQTHPGFSKTAFGSECNTMQLGLLQSPRLLKKKRDPHGSNCGTAPYSHLFTLPSSQGGNSSVRKHMTLLPHRAKHAAGQTKTLPHSMLTQTKNAYCYFLCSSWCSQNNSGVTMPDTFNETPIVTHMAMTT